MLRTAQLTPFSNPGPRSIARARKSAAVAPPIVVPVQHVYPPMQNATFGSKNPPLGSAWQNAVFGVVILCGTISYVIRSGDGSVWRNWRREDPFLAYKRCFALGSRRRNRLTGPSLAVSVGLSSLSSKVVPSHRIDGSRSRRRRGVILRAARRHAWGRTLHGAASVRRSSVESPSAVARRLFSRRAC